MPTQAEVGDHLDLRERRVRELMRDGILPTGGRGDHDLDACRIAYLRHLRERATDYQSIEGDRDLTEERARLAAAQADKTEMENAVTRSELIRRDDYEDGALIISKLISKRILAVGAKLQHKLAAESKPRAVRKLLDGAFREVLERLSRVELRVNQSQSESRTRLTQGLGE